jgi:hypothetical protein
MTEEAAGPRPYRDYHKIGPVTVRMPAELLAFYTEHALAHPDGPTRNGLFVEAIEEKRARIEREERKAALSAARVAGGGRRAVPDA